MDDREQLISQAIRDRRLLQFDYVGNDNPGIRVVCPHMLYQSTTGEIVLSASFVRGVTESNARTHWRAYRLRDMRDLAVLEDAFTDPASGYNPTGQKNCRRVIAAL